MSTHVPENESAATAGPRRVGGRTGATVLGIVALVGLIGALGYLAFGGDRLPSRDSITVIGPAMPPP